MRYLVCIVFGVLVAMALGQERKPVEIEGFYHYRNLEGTDWYWRQSAVQAIMDLSPEQQKALRHKCVVVLGGSKIYLDHDASEVSKMLELQD